MAKCCLRTSLLLSWVLLTAVGLAPVAAQHTKDSLDTVKRALQEKKALLVDVREQGEWDDGHLRDALLLPLSKLDAGLDAEALKKQLPPGKIIYTHCAAGKRCVKAADLLKKHGYDVRPLKEGYNDLLKAGFAKADK